VATITAKSLILLGKSLGPAGELHRGMLISLLPLVSLVSGDLLAGGGAPDELGVSTPRGAQVRLAELLAEADAIDAVSARRDAVVFTVERAGAMQEVVATVDARGQVVAVAFDARGDAAARDSHAHGSLGWLSRELDDALAITAIAVDRDGTITAITDDERRYRMIPTRDGNTAVEARWAAAWDAR